MTVITTDSVTGNSNDRSLCEAVYEGARAYGNAVIVSGDFMNMNGLNKGLGNEAGNNFMHLVSGIYHEELSKLNPGFLYSFRKDGDEMTFMLGSATTEAVQKQLDAAKKRVTEFVDKAGLSPMQHTKYAHLAGVGFVTALAKIDNAKAGFDAAYNDLQKDIAAQKKAQPAFKGDLVKDYVNITSTNKFNEALAEVNWSKDKAPVISLPPSVDIIVQGTKDFGDRNDRNRELREENGTLLRTDLYNLGGLNAALGPAIADRLIEHMTSIVRQEVQAQYPDARFYDVGAGVVDVLLPSANDRDVTKIKKHIHERLYNEILSKRGADYISERGITETPVNADAVIGQLPYKDGSRPGVGVVMSHVETEVGNNIPGTLSRLDAVANIQKIHAAAFLEKTADGHYKSYNLFPVGKSLDDFEIVDNIDHACPDALPYANSLKDRLMTAQLETIFAKPVGMIMQEVFGIDLTPVVARQKTIQEMLKLKPDEKGYVPLAEIINRTNSMVQFDFFHRGRPSINLLGRQETDIRSDPALMTMSLAKRWNVIPEYLHDLPEAILLAQAALRSSKMLETTVSVSREDSLSYLEKDIRVHVLKAETEELRRAQACEQGLKALQHIYNYIHMNVPDAAMQAAATMTREAFDEAAEQMHKCGEESLSLSLQETRNEPHKGCNIYNDIEQPEKKLIRALKEGVKLMEERGINAQPEVREKILSNLKSLQEAMAPEPPAPQPVQTLPKQSSRFGFAHNRRVG